MYLKGFLLLSIAIIVTGQDVSSLDLFYKESRIIGGVDENIEKAPWQISLQYAERHICGGSIYSHNIIITAGHCVNKLKPEDLQIRAGSTNHNDGGTLIKVAAIIKHERYFRPPFSNDIAVLRLKESLTFGTRVSAIPLAKESPEARTNATVTGWGYTGNVPKPSVILQSVQINILHHKICNLMFFGIITKEMVCAFGINRSACNGDSGGPLVVNGELVGIVSFGVQGCTGPTVFSNVAVMHNWILKAVETILEHDLTERPAIID